MTVALAVAYAVAVRLAETPCVAEPVDAAVTVEVAVMGESEGVRLPLLLTLGVTLADLLGETEGVALALVLALLLGEAVVEAVSLAETVLLSVCDGLTELLAVTLGETVPLAVVDALTDALAVMDDVCDGEEVGETLVLGVSLDEAVTVVEKIREAEGGGG